MYSVMSSQYSWEERDTRDAVQDRCLRIMAMGHDVKYKDTYDCKREFYINFESEADAVMFKLTHL